MTLFDKTLTPTPDEEDELEPVAPAPRVAVAAGHGRRVPMRADPGGGLTEFTRVVIAEPPPQNELEGRRLVSAIDQTSPVLDQLRNLAATLHQAHVDRELKVLTITSTIGGEGKTLLAANLALTLSRSYMRQVLLIDADLRRPGLHRVFGVPSQHGVRPALDSVRHGDPVVVQELAPRLALIPAGKPVRDPVSVFASDAMHRLVAAAAASFDWVIIDTPPVGMLPDVSLVASLSDGVVLVVEAGRVRYDLVQRSVESIGADRVLGVVLNKVPEKDIVSTYGMHYYAPYGGKPPGKGD